MKVALVLEQFDWRKGGLESWTWQFAQQLLRAGLEVHIVAFDLHPSAGELGIIAHRLERPSSRLKRALAFEQYLRGLDVDVIHDMGVGWYADIFHPHGGSSIATRNHNLLRIPRWRRFTFWSSGRRREMQEIERRQHANPGAVTIAVSGMVKDHLQTLHHLSDAKIRVIYNGVDLERFSPAHQDLFRKERRSELGLGDDEVLFFLLAHNLRLKNAATLIRSAGLLAGRNERLRVVIAGNDRAEPYRRLASKAGAGGVVSFLGLVDPVQYYASADVCVLPTWYDPCSLFTLEALASGLPVITTKYNGASELMIEGTHGYILDDPGNPAALAAKMAALLDSQTRSKMSTAARQLALAHSFERQTADFIGLYREICTKR